MYVEDDENNREVAKLHLEDKYKLIFAATSRSAANFLVTKKDEIEVILMDIELKGSELDGIILTKLLRGKSVDIDLPSYAEKIPVLDTPVIFITGYGARYPEPVLLEAGGDSVVFKPVEAAQLALALTQIRFKRRHLNTRKNEQTKPISSSVFGAGGSFRRPNLKEMAEPQEKKNTILYVEDDPENRTIAKLRLQESHEIHMACNSREACSFLAERGKEVDVILMDIELQDSDMDGILLTQVIRGVANLVTLPEYASKVPKLDVPIVFVTAYGDYYKESRLMAAGGDLVIRKPVNFVTLKMALTEIALKKNKERLKQMRR